eukprot:SAG31_NODE_3601_length_4085_cov_1.880582_9_plen_85_part_00
MQVRRSAPLGMQATPFCGWPSVGCGGPTSCQLIPAPSRIENQGHQKLLKTVGKLIPENENQGHQKLLKIVGKLVSRIENQGHQK